jgi:hypothetical protein
MWGEGALYRTNHELMIEDNTPMGYDLLTVAVVCRIKHDPFVNKFINFEAMRSPDLGVLEYKNLSQVECLDDRRLPTCSKMSVIRWRKELHGENPKHREESVESHIYIHEL